jgi:hypothetical protein
MDASLGLQMVMQAEAWGFEVRPRKRWEQENILVAEFEPIGSSLDESLRWLATNLGSDYDYRSALYVGLKRWFGRLMKSVKSTPGKLMCSESLTRMLQYAEYDAVQDLNPEITGPKDLIYRCLKSTHEFKVHFVNDWVMKWYTSKLLPEFKG